MRNNKVFEIISLFSFFRYRGGTFRRLILTMTESFVTSLDMREVDSFFTDHLDSSSTGLAVQQAKEIVRGNIAWLDYNESLIEKWINEYLSNV